MEDSEQRKKRLKEMRMQADLAGVSGGVEGEGMPGLLSNPLIEASSTAPSQDKSYVAPRFDFYTDPMNAFSSNKRNNTHIQSGPDYFPPPNFASSPVARSSSPHPASTNPDMTPSPTQVSPAPYRNPVWNGPRGPAHYNTPFHPSGGGTYRSPRFEPSSAPLYNSGGGTYPSPRFEPSRAPLYNSGGGTYPSPRFEPFGAPLYNSHGGTYPSPRFEPPGGPLYNSGQGMIHRPIHNPNTTGYRNNPSPSPGRGRGSWYSTGGHVLGQGSGRGPSSHGHQSNEVRASGRDRFYKTSMVEDPWRYLKPAIWKATDAEESYPASVNPALEPSLHVLGQGSRWGPSSHGHQSNEFRASGRDRFYKTSMVEDPWSHLKPAIWKATDTSLDMPGSSKPRTPKSVNTKWEESYPASVNPAPEPSLAEYLAAAFNEAANDSENV